MKFRVSIADSAIADAMEQYDYIRTASIAAADRWLDGLMLACESLERFPRRCRIAPDCVHLLGEIRQLSYGGHRILFLVSREEVRVFAVRHAARASFDPDE